MANIEQLGIAEFLVRADLMGYGLTDDDTEALAVDWRRASLAFHDDELWVDSLSLHDWLEDNRSHRDAIAQAKRIASADWLELIEPHESLKVEYLSGIVWLGNSTLDRFIEEYQAIPPLEDEGAEGVG